MKELADHSVDSIVTDPPYETGFMGKGWDQSGIAYDVSVWRECLRLLKPGGHLLAFGGSRTYHRLACAIEDAGFEIRDQIQWIYGSGFPKSLDVSKAIDAAAGVDNVVGEKPDRWTGKGGTLNFATDRPQSSCKVTVPTSDAAKQWDGWGTALKPAHEPIVMARKPLIGTVAENVLQHGTGGLNIDGCRIEGASAERMNTAEMGYHGGNLAVKYATGLQDGRWPANVIHDGSEEVLAGFPEVGSGIAVGRNASAGSVYGNGKGLVSRAKGDDSLGYADSGSAARFFYCAKASKEDREEGLEGMPQRASSVGDDRPSGQMSQRLHGIENRKTLYSANHHPTVKPTDLMRYLCRLVTPPNGIVLDPFCGSGSTGKAATLEGLNFIGIELSAEYCELAEKRIARAARQGRLSFGAEPIREPPLKFQVEADRQRLLLSA